MVVVSGGFFVLLTVLWLRSPWFLWQLLPAATDFKAVLKSDSRISGLVPGLQSVEPFLEASAQIGVARDAEGRTSFIIRPTMASYFSLRSELKAAGYSTHWYGPWLIAQQEAGGEWPAFWSAIIASGRGRGTAYQPLFIAEGKVAGLDKPVRAVATAVGEEWRVAVRETNSDEQFVFLPDRPPQLVEEEMADLSLAGATLAGWPEFLKNAWNQQLADKLGFTKTKPDFMAELAHYKLVQFTVRPQGARLAIFDKSERWPAAVTHWLEEEERHFRIQKRSFRLPDGTRGAEYVPGPRRVIFTRSNDHSACSEATVQERPFWLCGLDYSLFTSSEDLLDTAVPLAFEVKLGKNFLPAVAAKKLQAATVVMGEHEILLRLLWKSKR